METHSVPIIFTWVDEWLGLKAFRDQGLLTRGCESPRISMQNSQCIRISRHAPFTRTWTYTRTLKRTHVHMHAHAHAYAHAHKQFYTHAQAPRTRTHAVFVKVWIVVINRNLFTHGTFPQYPAPSLTSFPIHDLYMIYIRYTCTWNGWQCMVIVT